MIRIGQVEPVIDTGIRKVCKRPYAGHPKGCPNWNKKGRFTCPPHAPGLQKVLDLEKPTYVVVSAFDLGAHVKQMKAKHPEWSDRQLRCVLYWQGTARKRQRRGIKAFLGDYPGFIVLTCPEACGLMVSATVAPLGIKLEWPPREIVYHVALGGVPRADLRERYPEFAAAVYWGFVAD